MILHTVFKIFIHKLFSYFSFTQFVLKNVSLNYSKKYQHSNKVREILKIGIHQGKFK